MKKLVNAKNRGLKRVYTYASALAQPLFLKAGYRKVEDILVVVRGAEFVVAHMEKSFDSLGCHFVSVEK